MVGLLGEWMVSLLPGEFELNVKNLTSGKSFLRSYFYCAWTGKIFSCHRNCNDAECSGSVCAALDYGSKNTGIATPPPTTTPGKYQSY